MAAPIASFVRITDDSAYTGKTVRKFREQSRVVGVNTVYEQMPMFMGRQSTVVGLYQAAPAQITVSATTQDGISAGSGFLWIHMPSAVVSKKARIRRLFFTSQESAAFLSPTAPRVRLDRFTFTGTATGAGVAPVRSDNASGPWPALDLRTAVTGLVVTIVASLATSGIVGALSAISTYTPAIMSVSELISGYSEEDEWIVIAPGEGIVAYQDTVGTTADSRKLNFGVVWDEIDVA